MKKKIMSLALVISMVASLTACGSTGSSSSSKTESTTGSSTESTSSESTHDPVTLKVWIPASEDAPKAYYEKTAKAFQDKYSWVTVDYKAIPTNGADINTLWNSSALSGELPDVCGLAIAGVPSKIDYLENIQNYIDKINPDDKKDLYESVFSIGKIQDATYGVSYSPIPYVMAYRTDYFQEAGLTEPPKSVNDLLDYANKLVKKNADGSIARAGYDTPLTSANVFYWLTMYMQGAPITTEDGTKALCSDEASVKAFQLISDLSNQAIPYKLADVNTIPFFSGNSAISWIPMTAAADLQKTDLKDKVKFAGAINDVKGNPTSFSGSYVAVMTNTSKNKDVAWQFMEYMLSAEQMEAASNEIGIPVMRESLAKKFIEKNPELNTALLDSVKYGKSNPVLSFFSNYNTNVQKAYESVINHTQTPEKALTEAESSTNKEIGAI